MAKKRLRIGLAQEEENPILSSEQGISSNIVYNALLEKSFFLDIKEGKISWGNSNWTLEENFHSENNQPLE